MASYSEKLDMILVFNECHRKPSRQAAQFYAERYPKDIDQRIIIF